MDAVFSALSPTDKVLRLDTLVVDLGDIEDGEFSEKVFESRCILALEKALKEAIQQQISAQSVDDVYHSTEVSAFEAFVYFIKNGRLPWAFRVDSEEEWLFQVLTIVEKQPKRAAILRGPILENPTRLVRQFSLSFVWVLIKKLFPEWEKQGVQTLIEQSNSMGTPTFWKEFIETILRIAQRTNTATVTTLLTQITAQITASKGSPFMKQVLIIKQLTTAKAAVGFLLNDKGPLSIKPNLDDMSIEKTTDADRIAALIKAFDAETTVEHLEKKGPLSITTQNEPTDDGVGAEPIYVNQAGLPILLPFIESFFKAVELIDNKAFTDETARAKAVHLLHYLATGKTGVGEYDLALEKILCGVPLGMPIERDVVLTDIDLKAADDLLGVVIKYWTALGTCSIDGLRETFLQRPAKLTIAADDNWLLQVERRTVDILMDRLPWGISMGKTPWMSRLMVVEW
jgi:hypothetical protein